MPENLVHCRSCRSLLNTDLEASSVEIPAFVPLPEIESFAEMKPRGVYLVCPHCDRELRVNAKYFGQAVTCNSCSGVLQLETDNPNVEILGYFANCPHCETQIRIARKYAGIKVACKFCSGRIVLVE